MLKQVALLRAWFLFDRRTVKATLLAGGVTLLACLPYLMDDPVLFLRRLAVPQVTKDASGATWVVTLHYLGVDNVHLLGKWLTGLMPFVILILPLLVRADKWVGVALSYLVFIIMVKNVHEHYIMWSVIPLLVVYIRHRRLLSLGAALFGILTMILKAIAESLWDG